MRFKCIAREDASAGCVQLQRAACTTIAGALNVQDAGRCRGVPSLLAVGIQLFGALQKQACSTGGEWEGWDGHQTFQIREGAGNRDAALKRRWQWGMPWSGRSSCLLTGPQVSG